MCTFVQSSTSTRRYICVCIDVDTESLNTGDFPVGYTYTKFWQIPTYMMFLCTNACVAACVYACLRTLYVCIHNANIGVFTSLCLGVHACMCICTRAHMHVSMYAYTCVAKSKHACLRTQTYIYTNPDIFSLCLERWNLYAYADINYVYICIH